MQFDYSFYFKGCCSVSLLVVAGALIALFGASAKFAKAAIYRVIDTGAVGKYIIALCTCLFFLRMNGAYLINGGMYMLTEKENDAVEHCGYITQIDELGMFDFPDLKVKSGLNQPYEEGEPNGVQFTVDGIKCTAILRAGFEVGDYVKIVYLPKSGYILSIDMADSE